MAETDVEVAPDAADVGLGVLTLEGEPARFDAERVDALVHRAVAGAQAAMLDPDRQRAVRAMLKYGRYRATGRGKPAHELLHRFARDDAFPRVSPAVDTLNAVSLQHALPMSLVDLDRVKTGRFRLRRGRAGESYVFNPSGQSIELADLLLVARAEDDLACANPVKDAMHAKLTEDSRRFAAFVYAPTVELANTAASDLADAYRHVWSEARVSM